MMSRQKKVEGPAPHISGLTMSRLLFARVDRAVEQLKLPSRGDFMTTAITAILTMCQNHERRVLPEIVVRYDELRKSKRLGKLKIDDPHGAQRCGTYLSVDTEEQIAEVVKKIGWSRNQFIGEALKTLVDMCEDPSKRTLPLVVVLHDAGLAYSGKPGVMLQRRLIKGM